jgi:ATP-dependent Lon protease
MRLLPHGTTQGDQEELARLQGLEPAASEADVTRNYLDWFTQVMYASLMHS